MPNIYKFNISSDFVAKSTAAIESAIGESVSETIRIALSGGSSPKAVYEKLANSEKIDWPRTELYLVDERADHSNEKMVREALISKLEDLKAFYTFSSGLENRLKKLRRPFFDLVILGLGQDGHTASIFPGSDAINELEALVIKTESPIGIKQRTTLSFPALMSSQKIIFLIRGAEKKDTIEKWLSDESISENEIPAKIILEHPDVDIYYDYSS